MVRVFDGFLPALFASPLSFRLLGLGVKNGLAHASNIQYRSNSIDPTTLGSISFMFWIDPTAELDQSGHRNFVSTWFSKMEMFSENVDEKKELIRAIAKGRKLSDLPIISQPSLIIWGDQDQVFPLEFGYRLKRHLGDKAELAVIKNTGHAFFLEKRKEFYKLLKSFLLNSTTPSASPVPDL